MSDEKLTKDDLKLWKWYAKENVIPLGEDSSSTNSPVKSAVLEFSKEIKKFPNKELKIKKKNQKKYQSVIDLHGMTKNEAYQFLEIQISVSKLQGQNCILIITGKGHGKGEGLGVLKRKVPFWLEGPKFNSIVRSWEPALPGDGGDGAIYVYLF